MTRDEIRGLAVFAGLSDAGADRAAACATEVVVPAGQVLALQGDTGTGMFVVLEGTVTVELRGGNVELGPGEPVGEVALLAPESGRMARVRAKSPVRCLGISRDDFVELVEHEPGFALALLRTLAGRLASMSPA